MINHKLTQTPELSILHIIKVLHRLLPYTPLPARKKLKEGIEKLYEFLLFYTPSSAGEEENNLFKRFTTLILTEELYKNSNLTRDQLVRRLYTNKNKLINAIQSNTGMSFTEYINSLRLQESLRIIEEYPEFKIEVIAEKSGFGSIRSFQRQFYKKYMISPAEYRNGLKGKNHIK